MTDLRAAAPSINTVFEQLGPFSQAALPTFRTLGNLADTGRAALPAAEPVIRDIHAFAQEAKPFAAVLAQALTNLQGQRGIQNLLTVILETTGTANGFDSVGHFLRTFLTVPVNCLPYATAQSDPTCAATFHQARASAASTTTSPPAGALASSTGTTGNGSASLVDTPAAAPSASPVATSGGVGAPASGAPTSSGLLGYLLGGSGTR